MFGIGSDHELEAYEDMVVREEYPSIMGTPRSSYTPRRRRTPFVKDPLYYHTQLDCVIIRKSGAAYCIKLMDGRTFWAPKVLCRKLRKKSLYLYTKFYEEKIRELSKCSRKGNYVR